MKVSIHKLLAEATFLCLLCLGLVVIANAQSTGSNNDETPPTKKVRVEVEITENGKTSTSVQELTLDKESINGQLDEMVEEIEMILEEAVEDIEETDLEITIRRNQVGDSPHHPQYRTYMSMMPEAPMAWDEEGEKRAFLGVYASQLGDERLEVLNLEKAVELDDVVDGSAAATAGLKKGDIVTSIGGEPVGNFVEVAEAIRRHEPGATVEIELIRDGAPQTVSATLGANQRMNREVKVIKTVKPFLGVRGKDHEEGALIESVIEETPASESDLQAGDIITALNGQEINSFESLGEAIRSQEPGATVSLEYLRDGAAQSMEIEIGEREEVRRIVNGVPHPPHPPRPPHPHGNKDFDFDFDFDFDDKEEAYHYEYHYEYDGDEEDEEMDPNAAFLGIVGESVEEGVRVNKVFEGSTAEALGLAEGDIIRKLDNEGIDDISELVDYLEEKSAGDEIKVSFERDGEKMKESGELGSKAAFKRDIMERRMEHHAERRAHHERSRHRAHGDMKRIRMRIAIEEISPEELREISEKTGQPLDENNSLELNNFSVSPNPSRGPITLKFDVPNEGSTEIRVFDLNGALVFEQQLEGFSGIYSQQIDLSDESAGTYIISIVQQGKGYTARLVKQ